MLVTVHDHAAHPSPAQHESSLVADDSRCQFLASMPLLDPESWQRAKAVYDPSLDVHSHHSHLGLYFRLISLPFKLDVCPPAVMTNVGDPLLHKFCFFLHLQKLGVCPRLFMTNLSVHNQDLLDILAHNLPPSYAREIKEHGPSFSHRHNGMGDWARVRYHSWIH